MIIYDTETTAFLGNSLTPLDQQPDVIEIGAVKLNDETLEEVATIGFLIQPRVLPISKETTKANGITTEMLTGAPKFSRILPKLIDFFLGERQLVAHNISFDVGVTAVELRRLDYLTKFPWPPIQTDSTTLASDLEGASHTGRHRLGALYEQMYGKSPSVAHRALDDARTLADIVRWLRTHDGRI